MPTLHLDADLHYDDIGEGPPIVFLHGVTSTGALEWRGLVGTLADDYRCITLDLRGHGQSELGTAPLTIATLVDDFNALGAELEVKRPHLVGFSIGSHTVLRAALARPEAPASLTLLGFSTGRPPEVAKPDTPIEPPDDWPVALRRAQQHKGEDYWRTLYSSLATDLMSEQEVGAAALAALTCPVLIVNGADEPKFKHRQSGDLVAAVAGARVETIDNAGHPVHQEQAHIVNRLVLDFINTAEAEVTQ
ncbi:MAG: alpha/beta fold hydrolase [Actinomycetota bacterium]|nr:alpha/beta fold hydrolase [Actinomycetota bacterium]